MQTELLKQIDLEIEKSRGALARDTIKLVRINSEKSAPQPGAPFGLGAKEVLDTVLEMGKEVVEEDTRIWKEEEYQLMLAKMMKEMEALKEQLSMLSALFEVDPD